MGLPTWTCPFRVFQRLGGGENLPVMSFAFSDLSGRVYPPVMSLSHFSMCHGGETLSSCQFRIFDVLWWGNPLCHVVFTLFDVPGWGDLLVTSISYFRRAVVGKPSPSRRVHFIRHFVVGKSSPFVFLMFQGEKTLSVMLYLPFSTLSVFFCELLKIYTLF